MIENVKLVNFISHKDTDLPLGPGVTVFVGRNGSGKSSIIDGITYALYGKHVRGDNASLVKHGASIASASVRFTVGAREYVVERKVNGKGQLEGSVLKEVTGGMEKQLAAGERRQFDESLSEEVGKVIGLDYGRMRVAAIIQQGELDSIVTDFSPKQFKELVNGLIGIDRLETAYQNMLSVLNDFRSQLRDKYLYDDTNVESLAASASLLDASLKATNEALGKEKKVLDTLRSLEAKLESKVKALEPLKEKAGLLRSSIGNLVDYVSEERRKLQRELEELGRVAKEGLRLLPVVARETATIEKLAETAKLISKADTTIEANSSIVGGLRTKKTLPREMGQVIAKARASLVLVKGEKELQGRLGETKSSIARLDSAIRTTREERAKLQAFEETAQKLEFKDGICPVCGTRVEKINELFDIKSIRNHIAEHESEAEELEGQKKALESKQASMEDGVTALKVAKEYLSANKIAGEGDLRSFEEERNKLVVDIAQLPTLTAQLEKAKKRKEKLAEARTKLAASMNEISAGKSYLADHGIASKDDVRLVSKKAKVLFAKLARIPEDIDPLREAADPAVLRSLSIDSHSSGLLVQVRKLSREASRFDAKDYEEKADSLNETRSKWIPDQTAKVEVLSKQAKTDGESLRGMNEALMELRKAQTLTEVLTKIRDKVYYRDGPVPTSLRSWALSQIGAKASEYAASFGIGVSNIQLKEKARNISIECYGPRGIVETPSLSGGEKVAVALALRFGMAYVMGGYKLDFVVLDEPTVHLDEERKASMVDIISNLGAATSPLKQVIIITHDSEIFENADVDAVYRFEASPEGTRVVPLSL